tara:strand:+ start:1782 stop:2588 length:807 start_codon:yes stop_codon:yes gene_type:complete
MKNVLLEICEQKLIHIKKCKQQRTENQLLSEAKNASKQRGFLKALEQKSKTGYGLIGEIKKASPSKGLIRKEFDVAHLAKAYEEGGAACLSVLTDIPYFKGSDKFLVEARGATLLPVLRKDFMLDTYQVIESRVLGADCILLIMAALEDDAAKNLEDCAIELGMDVLVEIHDEDELYRALKLKTKLLGVNNRNLKTMATDISMTEKLASLAPAEKILISESGLQTRADLRRMANVGARCFLIGESIMKQKDVEKATKLLLTKSTQETI